MKNALAMAYMGDAVYEEYVRKYLLDKGIVKVKELQNESLKYVSASSQRRIVESLISRNVLNEEEIELFKWGRNAHGGRSKSSDIVTYRIATGLEALIGCLYVDGKYERIEQIMKEVFCS